MSHDAHIAFFMNALRSLLLRLLLLLLLLEIAILGLTHRKHGYTPFIRSIARLRTLVHTVHAVENPFCILQPNNKRCSSSRPPVSLSLRSVRRAARCELGNGITSQRKRTMAAIRRRTLGRRAIVDCCSFPIFFNSLLVPFAHLSPFLLCLFPLFSRLNFILLKMLQ